MAQTNTVSVFVQITAVTASGVADIGLRGNADLRNGLLRVKWFQ